MRLFPLLAFSNILLGFELPLHRLAPTSKSMLFPKLNKLHKYPAFSTDRRRPSNGVSDQCISDIFSDSVAVWCIHPQVSCGVLGPDHTKWVIHIDNDIEHMCYPSSCSGNDLEYLYTWEMEDLNSAAKYCTLNCPAIEFNINGTSDDGQKMAVSGMYNYADLSYDCAGAAAMVEISTCEETGTCPSDANGLTTCELHYEDSLSYANMGLTWKVIGYNCLPDECTDEENLKKMEDFHYALLTYYQLLKNGVYLSPEETREGYLVEYSCPTPTDEEGNRDDEDEEHEKDEPSEEEVQPSEEETQPPEEKDQPSKEEEDQRSELEEEEKQSEGEGEGQPSKQHTSSRNYSSYVLIVGVTSAVLLVLFVFAICMIRVYRGGGVTMTPIISVELNSRETFTTLCDISTSSK